MTGTSVTFDIIGRDRSGSDAFNKVANSANRADGAMSKFSAGAAKVAKAALAATAVAGGFAAKLGYDAVMAASDLNETLSKSQVIFGKHADGMAAWAARADQSMGLSQQAALNAATGFGDMFSQLGFTNDQAVKMSKGVVQLSADLGSFNNLETADVAERMSAAFRGEFDSLQALIPNINAARVQTQALAMTGKKNAEQLTAQEKAAATLAIVTKDGARAQGDFARTSDGLANQTKILKAQLDNASASFGQKLLPLAVDFAQFANRELVPAIEKGAEWLGDRLPGAIDTVVDAGRDMRKAVAPAVEEIVEALGNLADEGDAAGRLFSGVFIPALRETAEIVAHVVDFIDDLPGPVKEVGVQAAFAAYGLHKLNGAMIAVKGSGFVTTMMDAEQRTAKFGSVARGAAGVGGILLLTKAMQDAGDEGASFGDVLSGAAGGAGIGAMFGPIGALVGAGAGGGLAALRGAFADTKDEARTARLELLRTEGFQNAKDDAKSLSDALAGVVNQYGKVTRAAVESSFMGDDGQLDADVQALRDLGVSMDTIVSATLGQADAQAIVNDALNSGLGSLQSHADAAKAAYDDVSDGARDVVTATGEVIKNGEMLSNDEVDLYEQAWKDAKAAVDEMTATQDVFNDRVGKNTGAIKDHRAQMRQLASDMGVPLKAYKDFPKEVRTRFEAQGLVQTADDAVKLIGRYEGLQKFSRIKAVVSAPGVDLTTKQVIGLVDKYDLTPAQVKTLVKSENIPATVRQILGVQADLRDLDRQQANPKTALELAEYHRQRAALIASLNSIPDEEVTIWTTRRDRNPGGGPSGGGPDLGYGDGNGRVAALGGGGLGSSFPTMSGSRFAAVQSRARASGATHAARRSVIEVRLIPAELDWSKAKTQINGEVRVIAGDVFVEQYQEERNFERQQR